ncbi:MAG: glycosyltransferase family 4 protein [Halobacteriota archaeon]
MPNLNINLLYFASSELHTGTWGGARLKSMIDIFEQLGVNIHLLSYILKDKIKIEDKQKGDFLKTTIIYFSKSLPKFLKVLGIPLIFMYGLKYVKRSDIIFAHSPGITTGFPAVVLAKMFNKPLIIDYMDVRAPDTPIFIHNVVLKNSTVVFAISHYLVDETKRYGCENIVYLPTFVDTNLFKVEMNARKRIRADLRIEDDDVVIGYAGSFWYVEGVSNLLQAFKNLLKSYSNIKMIIIGGKKYKIDADIPKLVKDLNLEGKVTVVPPQPHKNVPTFLSACDIMCCPKIDCEINRVANPIKVVEYLAMGLPTVCSAVGGIVDTIEDGVDGFLVKPGDIKDLEKMLEWIILNPERSKEIGENGRKKAINEYSYGAIEDTIRRAISEIIDMKNGNKMGERLMNGSIIWG